MFALWSKTWKLEVYYVVALRCKEIKLEGAAQWVAGPRSKIKAE